MSEPTARDERNWLLAQLSDSAYARVLAIGQPVDLRLRDVLFEPNEPIEYVHFPETACLSIVSMMDDGHAVEVGSVGPDGFTGLSLIRSIDSEPTRCIVQIGGSGKRIGAASFARELKENRELAHLVDRYAQAWMDQIGRSGTCNAVHSIEQRCARWLLMTHDRLGSDVLPLTQEVLAAMLGVRRPSVTLAARSLQRAGLIHYTRGRIKVLDRAGLEAASCECYHAIQTSYGRLLSRRIQWAKVADDRIDSSVRSRTQETA